MKSVKKVVEEFYPEDQGALRFFTVPYFSVRAAMLDLNVPNHPPHPPLSRFDTHPLTRLGRFETKMAALN